MIPVTPPAGSEISSNLFAESHAKTLTVSSDPLISIVVVVPGVKVPTIFSTVKRRPYLYTLPAAPEAAETASSTTNPH